VDVLLTVLVTVLGLLLGSFANVPIHRWPRGGTVATPRQSRCWSCERSIAPYDNVPVVSWLVLRGRCRHCDAAISPRYPAVEALTGVSFLAVALVHGFTWLLPALLAFVWVLVVASAVDLEHRIIPNRLTYPAPAVLSVLLLGAAAFGSTAWADLRRGFVAAVLVPASMLLVSELYRLLRGRVGVGMGDVKLAVSIGLVVGTLGGWHLVIFAYGSVIAAVFGSGLLLAAGRARLASRIPFGPYLAMGALLAVLAGEYLTPILESFLGL
jgi:leader peptidase (prepilin peptidase) / N-methyltransferase